MKDEGPHVIYAVDEVVELMISGVSLVSPLALAYQPDVDVAEVGLK